MADKKGIKFDFWKTNPIWLRLKLVRSVIALELSITSCPLMITLPEVGGLIRPTAVRSVDLPAPLGPSSAITSPCRTEKVTSRMATTSVLPLP